MIPDLGDLTDPFLCCFLLPPLTVPLWVAVTAAEAAEAAGAPLLVFSLFGKDAAEEERLSSRRDSERDCVDLAEPELRDPVPRSRERDKIW